MAENEVLRFFYPPTAVLFPLAIAVASTPMAVFLIWNLSLMAVNLLV